MRRFLVGRLQRVASSHILALWGGWAAVLSGVLFGAWGYLHGVVPHVDARVGPLACATPLLFLAGLAGLRSREAMRESRLGDTGFLIGFIGTGVGVVKGAGLSVPINWVPVLFACLTVLGVAACKEIGARSWGILLLAMAVLGWAYFFTDTGHFAATRAGHVAFAVLFSLGWLTLGCALIWSSRSTGLRNGTQVRK